ncbi:DUF423 domain-containing protein [Sphingomonas bacterium]|uniref:DUF423 domain-containing protein n=1 Tax=Sphingomonas bacterium TaxID=1895847 RepID=UPI0015763965|nr:DUF423 domain-containing protein [Sphingomonas bacterium]
MNWLAILAALSGALAVGAGAFGAHGTSGQAAELLKTGSHYQLIHAVAALVAMRLDVRGPGWLFVTGGALFAVSLYALAIGAPRLVGVVTPIGGALLIGGWLWLAWAARG